jgi:hypothetical protein
MGEGGIPWRGITRRRFLAASVATAGAVAGLGISQCDPTASIGWRNTTITRTRSQTPDA